MPNPGLAPWAMQECRPCRAYITFRFVCPQGFILGFALISPWAMQEYRPKGLFYVFPISLLFDAVALLSPLRFNSFCAYFYIFVR